MRKITLLRLSFAIESYFKSYAGLSKKSWQGIFINFIVSSLMGVFYFLSLYFINILHFNIALVGSIISFYGIGAIFGGLMGGKLSDRISPKIVSMLSLLIQSITFLVLIKLSAIYLLKMDVFLLGFATYSFLTSNYVWILNQCDRDQTEKFKAINILSAGANLGLGLSAFVVGILSRYGFNYIFIASGVLLFLCACYLFFQEKHEISLDESKKVNTVKQESLPYNRIKILVLLCVFFVGIIVAQTSSTYPVYLQSAFPLLGSSAAGILFALNSFLVAFFQVPLVGFFNDSNKIFIVGLGAFLLGFGMVILSFSFSFILAIFSCIIYTAGEMLFFSASQLVCYEGGTENTRGNSLGYYRMIYASSRFVGPILGGFIYYHLGGNVVWYLSGIIGILCFLACNYYKEYR